MNRYNVERIPPINRVTLVFFKIDLVKKVIRLIVARDAIRYAKLKTMCSEIEIKSI